MRPVQLRFDRGTILIDNEGLQPMEGLQPLLARLAPLAEHSADGPTAPADDLELRWDPRVGAYRAPAHRYLALRRALTAAEVPWQTTLAPPGSLRGPLRALPLRSYQREALQRWRENDHQGLVVLPTGSGKTRVALAALAALARATLVLVPTRVLLGQWVDALGSLQIDGVRIGVLGDGRRELRPITVATFESAYRHADRFGHCFALVVVDEAHHFGSGARAEALEMCIAPARLGLTATLPDDPAALDRLRQLIGPVVCRYATAQLCGEHLAPFDRVQLFVDLDDEERRVYEEARRCYATAYRAFVCSGGKSWSAFVANAGATLWGRRALHGFAESRRVVSTARAKLALVQSLLQRHADDRLLIFTADNSAAYTLSRRLLIPAITCDIVRAERAAVLGRLRQGRLRALISSRVLNEGIDLPEARVGIIVGGAQGRREHVQRVGRLLRPRPGKRAVIYELIARETFEVGHASRRQRALVA
jgi:superfamily II DNA or RNA helicase